MYIQDWINDKYKEIAGKISTLVHMDTSGYSFGFNIGYKQALIDLEDQIENGIVLYKSRCKCGDKYHERDEICL